MNKVATSTPRYMPTEFAAMLETLQQFCAQIGNQADQFDASQLRKLDAAAMSLIVAINVKRLGSKAEDKSGNVPEKATS